MLSNSGSPFFHFADRAKLLMLVMSILVCVGRPATAQINVSQGKPIIDGSGSWDGGNVGVGAPYNGGSFPAHQVVDGNTAEPNDGALSYWLGREGLLDEYFTLDLGDFFEIDRIDLFNTHNRQFNDRSTDEFVIFSAFAVDELNQLIDPTPIVSGNLSNVAGQAAITPDSFTLTSPITTRYLKFQSITAQPGLTNVGLNEIQVFASNFNSPNKALGKPVIDGSGSWDGGVVGTGTTFDGGTYPATKVTDGSLTDSGYWLGREGTTNEYFTLDLQAPIEIQEILLRNTHNSVSGDRGTRDFRIWASNAVDGSNNLVNPVEILTGSLPNSIGMSPLPGIVYTASNGLAPTNARYLRFESLSDTYFNGSIGLNEIEVYTEAMHAPTPAPPENVALGKPIIDGSSSWDGAAGQPFDAGTFPANRVVDGSRVDYGDARTSFWIANENCPGPNCATPGETETYFTVDLGNVYDVDQIDLTNTHNRQYNDRGTEEFVIYGATEVDANNDLVNPIVILSGTLARTDGQTVITPEIYTIANGLMPGNARYLKFQALTYYSSAANGGAGLNDIAVYGSIVPEPGTMMLGLAGILGLVTVRRRASRAR